MNTLTYRQLIGFVYGNTNMDQIESYIEDKLVSRIMGCKQANPQFIGTLLVMRNLIVLTFDVKFRFVLSYLGYCIRRLT